MHRGSHRKSLSKTELRWAVAAFGAIFPRGAHEEFPGIDDLGHVATSLQSLVQAAPARAVMGLRVALLVSALAPMVVLVRFTTLARVDASERGMVMRTLLASRFYPIRQLALLLKMIGGLVFARAPEVRAVMLGRDSVPVPAASGPRLVDGAALVRRARGAEDGRRIA